MLNSAPVQKSEHTTGKKSNGEQCQQRVTYRLNSAPVHNSGHTTGKKRVMANNIKWTESNLQAEFITSAQ